MVIGILCPPRGHQEDLHKSTLFHVLEYTVFIQLRVQLIRLIQEVA